MPYSFPSDEKIVTIRNRLLSVGYRFLLKPAFFRVDPEQIHDRFVQLGQWLGSHSFTRRLTAKTFGFHKTVLGQTVAGMSFSNPIGLSAGFDKEGVLTDIMPLVGFGFMEVGSVTGLPCPGNRKPRLWRLPKSRSLVVYYGLKSQGSKVVASRLRDKQFSFPVGVSIAKANLPSTDNIQDGINDYLKAVRDFSRIGHYFAINISCPNTSGGEPFVQPQNLEKLLSVLNPLLSTKPSFIKLPADIEPKAVQDIIDVAKHYSITGFICTNLTKQRNNPKILDENVPPQGGLSGKVVEERSNTILKFIRQKNGNRFILIGSGGVFSAEDAYRKIKLGASLVEMITGMVFKGPQVISEINLGLTRLLAKDGFHAVSQAVGADVD